MHKLYTELGKWWPLLSPPEDYLDEANFFYEVLVAAGLPPAPTLLELGCGVATTRCTSKRTSPR